jgi:cell division septation protein DedD
VRVEVLGADGSGAPPAAEPARPGAATPPSKPTRTAAATTARPRPPDPARWVPPDAYDLPAATYAVQVAALSDRAKAQHLRNRLAMRFPDTFVSPLEAGSSRYYRVRIGPYPLRGVAVARAEMVSRLGYPAVIVEDAPQ